MTSGARIPPSLAIRIVAPEATRLRQLASAAFQIVHSKSEIERIEGPLSVNGKRTAPQPRSTNRSRVSWGISVGPVTLQCWTRSHPAAVLVHGDLHEMNALQASDGSYK